MSIDDEALARLREDYVLVPRRATPEMLAQFKRPPFAGLTIEDRYARMLASAPETELAALLDIAEAVANAPTGTIDACNFADYERPAWVVIDDRERVPLNEPKRVRIVSCTGGAE